MGFVIKQPRPYGEAELVCEDPLIQSKGERAELHEYLKPSALNFLVKPEEKSSTLKDKLKKSKLPSLYSFLQAENFTLQQVHFTTKS